jgi:hypothetical protein
MNGWSLRFCAAKMCFDRVLPNTVFMTWMLVLLCRSRLLKICESMLNVTEYTDKIDIYSYHDKVGRSVKHLASPCARLILAFDACCCCAQVW